MKVKRLAAALLLALVLLTVAARGEEQESSRRKKDNAGDIDFAIELVLRPDGYEVFTKENFSLVKTVLANRLLGFNITVYDIEYSAQHNEIYVCFNLPNDGDFDLGIMAERLCERALLAFCRGETQDEVILSGEGDVKKASVKFRDDINEWVVNLKFTEEGAKKFAEATAEMIGQRISIWLDDNMISAPTVQTAITDGEAIITGLGDKEDAQYLANRINGGTLPFKLTYDEDSIKIRR